MTTTTSNLPARSPRLAIFLMLLCIGCGAAIACFSVHPAFRAEAEFRFRMTIPDMRSATGTIVPNYPYFVNSQMQIMTSPEIIERAMFLPQWKSLGRPMSDLTVADFRRNLRVKRIRDSEIVVVSFTDPDEAVARAGAGSLCTAYESYVDDSDPLGFMQRAKYWDNRVRELSNELADEKLKLAALVKQSGTDDLAPLVEANLLEADRLRRLANDAAYQLEAAQNAYSAQQSQPPATQAASGMAPGPNAISLAATQEKIEEARLAAQNAKRQYEQQAGYANMLSAQSQAIAEQRHKIDATTSKLDEGLHYAEDLKTQFDTSGRSGLIELLSHGTLRTEEINNRRGLRSLVGGLLGLAGAIVLLASYAGIARLARI